MTKRKISIVIGAIVIISSVFMMSFLSKQRKAPERKKPVESNLLISTLKVENHSVHLAIPVLGTISPINKVELYSEVMGVLEPSGKAFLEGAKFQKGEVLFRINAEEATLSLMARKSNLLNLITSVMPKLKYDYPESFAQWQEYLNQFEIESNIKDLPTPLNKQEKFFLASNNIYQTFYEIESLENRLAKYVIRAPYSGVVTESNIKPGTLVRSGQKLGEFINSNNYELEVQVRLEDIQFVSTGDKAELHSESVAGSWNGKVTRISEKIDTQTQTVKVFLQVSGKNLKESMFLKGDLFTSSTYHATEIPRKLLMNETQIYVVKDSTLSLQEVKVVQLKAETAVVEGLEQGMIISTRNKGVYDGMKVSY